VIKNKILRKSLTLTMYVSMSAVLAAGIVALLSVLALSIVPGAIQSIESDFISIVTESRTEYAVYTVEQLKQTWGMIVEFWLTLWACGSLLSVGKTFYPSLFSFGKQAADT